MHRLRTSIGLLVALFPHAAPAELSPAASIGGKFGSAIGSTGFDTVIAAEAEDGEGAVFVYSRTFQTWGQDTRVNPPDVAGTAFGATVALAPDGRHLVVGRIPNPSGSRRELLSYRKLASGEWQFEATLTHPQPLPGSDSFGVSGVAIGGDLLLVGDPLYNEGRGGVFIYRRAATGWVFEGNVGAGLSLREGDQFGEAVATDGMRVIVGAWGVDRGSSPTNDGKAFIFERSGTGWLVVATFASPDTGGQARFGRAVAIEGSTAIVGADGDAGSNRSGAAYVYTLDGGAWASRATLEPSDGAADDLFGYSVSLTGTNPLVALIGAPGEDHSSKTENGAAYVFTGSGATWTQRRKLHPVKIENDDEFGRAVSVNALSGLLVATVGAPLTNAPLSDQGAAYIYESTNGGVTWSAPLPLIGAEPPEISGDVGNGRMLEDSIQTRAVTLTDEDTPAESLLLDANASPSLFANIAGGLNPGGANRTLTLQPKSNEFGSGADITLEVTDGLAVGSRTFEIDVVPVNDKPSVTLGALRIEHEVAGSTPISKPGFATFSAGPANEASQSVDRYELRVVDPSGVLSAEVRLLRDGLLNYVLSGAPGQATVGVKVRDTGGTTDGGVNLSDEVQFVIENGTARDELFRSGFED